jgi:hypothetical protein
LGHPQSFLNIFFWHPWNLSNFAQNWPRSSNIFLALLNIYLTLSSSLTFSQHPPSCEKKFNVFWFFFNIAKYPQHFLSINSCPPTFPQCYLTPLSSPNVFSMCSHHQALSRMHVFMFFYY